MTSNTNDIIDALMALSPDEILNKCETSKSSYILNICKNASFWIRKAAKDMNITEEGFLTIMKTKNKTPMETYIMLRDSKSFVDFMQSIFDFTMYYKGWLGPGTPYPKEYTPLVDLNKRKRLQEQTIIVLLNFNELSPEYREYLKEIKMRSLIGTETGYRFHIPEGYEGKQLSFLYHFADFIRTPAEEHLWRPGTTLEEELEPIADFNHELMVTSLYYLQLYNVRPYDIGSLLSISEGIRASDDVYRAPYELTFGLVTNKPTTKETPSMFGPMKYTAPRTMANVTNKDVIMSILISTPYETLMENCKINNTVASICSEPYFWKLKTMKDFGLSSEAYDKKFKERGKFVGGIQYLIPPDVYLIYRMTSTVESLLKLGAKLTKVLSNSNVKDRERAYLAYLPVIGEMAIYAKTILSYNRKLYEDIEIVLGIIDGNPQKHKNDFIGEMLESSFLYVENYLYIKFNYIPQATAYYNLLRMGIKTDLGKDLPNGRYDT